MTCVTSQFKEKNRCGPRYDISIFYVADAGKCFTILESSVSLKKIERLWLMKKIRFRHYFSHQGSSQRKALELFQISLDLEILKP